MALFGLYLFNFSNNSLKEIIKDRKHRSLYFSADGKTLADYPHYEDPDFKRNDDNLINLWDLSTCTITKTLNSPAKFNIAILSLDNETIVTLGKGETSFERELRGEDKEEIQEKPLFLLDISTNQWKQLATLRFSNMEPPFTIDQRNPLTINSDRTILAFCERMRIYLVELSTNIYQVSLECTYEIKAIAFVPDTKYLISTEGNEGNNLMRFWDTETGRCLYTIADHQDLKGLAITPEKNILTASLDLIVKCWKPAPDFSSCQLLWTTHKLSTSLYLKAAEFKGAKGLTSDDIRLLEQHEVKVNQPMPAQSNNPNSLWNRILRREEPQEVLPRPSVI